MNRFAGFLLFLLAANLAHAAGDNFILKYAKEGDAGGIQSAYGLGGNINCRDVDGKTPLIIVAGYNDWIHFDTMKVIMGFNPDVNAVDNDGNTAYFYAQQAGNQRGMDLLLEKGADPKKKGEAKKSGGAIESVKNLFGFNDKPEPKAENKITLVPASKANAAPASSGGAGVPKISLPSVSPSTSPNGPSKIEIGSEDAPPAPSLIDAVKTGDAAKVKDCLADIRTIINVQDRNGWSALMYAVQMNQPAIVSLLLDRGANVNSKDLNGWTPLHLAANNGSEPIVGSLLSKGSDVNAATSKGTTPLILASGRGFKPVVEKLIASSAVVPVKDKEGKSALNYATEKNHPDVVEVLKKAGAGE